MTKDAKIGIGIVHCQSTPGSTNIGFTLVYKSDNGNWSSIIDDTGAVFRYVKINYETILRMVHFSKDGGGWYMCSMKPIPGRDEEYRASWVYFPSSLDLSQKDIKNVIEVAESQIGQNEFDSNKLQEVIRSYTLCKEFSPRYMVPSVQHGFAFRDISGDYNLYDLYRCMYQKDFTQYEWVILMEKSLLTFKGEGIEDISNRKILKSYVIKPSSNEFGFIPYHNNGAEFKSPVLIFEGEALAIKFIKPGYMTIPKDIKSQADFAISVSECKKYFKKNKFKAYDSKTNKQIVSAQIKPLNAEQSKDGLYWIFAEQNLENAKFDVKEEGYTASTHELDLRNKSLEDDIKILLDPESHKYIFVLPLDNSVVKDCETAEVVIHSQFVIKESPFKGFKCSRTPQEGGAHNRLTAVSIVKKSSGKVNNGKNVVNNSSNETRGNNSGIKPTSKNHKVCWFNYKFKSVIIGVGVGVAAFMLIISLAYVLLHIKSCDDDTTGEDARNGEFVCSSEDNWNDAYNYLKEHTYMISKKDIDNFDELNGLYDIINSYRFKDLVCFIDKHKHRDDILKIEDWKRLYDKAKEIGQNKNGVYNSEESDQTEE